ncbi:MAG: DEAD/DEAH box helicase, partial [Anaerotignum sp.]
MKEIQLISKETRGKITHEEIVDLLQSLQQYHENLEAYEVLAEQAVEVFDGKTYDIYDDWKWQKMWVDAFFDFCKLFVTNQDGYAFLEKAPWDDMLSLLEGAESLNRWFEENEQAKTQFGSLYHGQATDTELLRKYGEVARVFGERVAAALICGYAADKKRMTAYCQCLRQMVGMERYLRQIYSSEREYQEAVSLELPVLVDQIRRYMDGAKMILSVYAFAKKYEGAKGLPILSPAMLKQDLQKIFYCQREKKKSIAQQEKHRMVLGVEYRGTETNWNTIKENIAFSERLHRLLGGEVPQGLEDAFLKQTVHFTAASLGQLQQKLTTARKLEKAYPVIEEKQEWKEKGVVIATVRKEMEKVFFVRDIMGRDCSYIDMVEDLSQLAAMQAAQRKYEQEITKAQRTLSVFHLTVDSDLERLAEALRHMKEIKKGIRREEIDKELALWLTNSISYTTVDKYQEQMMRLLGQKKILTDITGLFSPEEALGSLSLRRLGKRIGICREQFETMDGWIDLQECKKACQENGLGAFVLQGEEEEYPAGKWKDIFLKSFFYAWISAVSPSMKAVAAFRMPVQEKKVEQFCTLDTHQLLVNRLRIRERLIGKMPTKQDVLWAGDQMGILLRELGKKRRLMPLRKLFREIPELLLQLKPCLMTSPLSVSYYLDLDRYQFDLVIFDEASQIFPQDAIGSILRGKQVIIAGDSKQLPPTNFFAVSMGDEVYDGAEEEEEIFADSILEQAAACLQNCALLWHYRSHYEELISFSNREIYQNTLITFPSSVTHERNTGVEYIYVENGIYENRCNREEARRIAALVSEHIQNHPERSLGVIAFSESQQSMIEEEVYAYRMENPEEEWFFGEEREE